MTSPLRILQRRHRRFIGFVWFSLGAGWSAVLASLTLVRLDSLWPVRASPLPRADAVPDTVWRSGWTESAITVAQSQAASVRVLTGVLLVLALAGAGIALVNTLAMIAARRAARRDERVLRAALGSTPGRFLRERLSEDAFLYGGGLGLALLGGTVLVFALRQVWPAGLLPPDRPAMTGGVLLLAGTVMLVALLALRGGRGPRRIGIPGGRATAGPAAGREQAIPVVIQLALALALASAAALLLRHGRSAAAGTAATDGPDLVTVEIAGAPAEPSGRSAAWSALLTQVSAVPGVAAESLASPGAWLGLGIRDEVMVECGQCVRGQMYMPIQPAVVLHHAVSAGFFEAMGIPVVAGRGFAGSDTWDSARVAIVNETFARTRFDRAGPIGRGVQLHGKDGEWYTVVGVVRDVPARGIGAPRVAMPALYLATTQEPPSVVGLAARTPLAPAALAERVEAAVREVLPAAAVRDAERLPDRIDRAVAPLRWFALLFAILAGAAFVLAVHGVFSLVRAQVRARRRELAVRAAIGASPRGLFALVLGRTARTTLTGVLLGGVVAWSAGRALQLQLGGLPPLDLPVALRIAAVLSVAALLGALPGARRAALVPPGQAMRED